MHGEHTEGCRFSFANQAGIKIAAGKLEGMTNKKYVFLLLRGRIIIPAFNFIYPPAPGNIPVFKSTHERITGASFERYLAEDVIAP